MISVRKGKVYKKVVKYGLLSKPYQTPPSPLVFFLSVRTFFGFLRQSWEDQTVLFAKFTKICPDDENDDDENDDDNDDNYDDEEEEDHANDDDAEV